MQAAGGKAAQERDVAQDALKSAQHEAARKLLKHEDALKQLQMALEASSRQVDDHTGQHRHTMPSELMGAQPYPLSFACMCGSGALIIGAQAVETAMPCIRMTVASPRCWRHALDLAPWSHMCMSTCLCKYVMNVHHRLTCSLGCYAAFTPTAYV